MVIKVVSMEKLVDDAVDFVNLHPEQLGFVLPVTKGIVERYFRPSSSYLLLSDNDIVGVFSYISGTEKTAPTGFLRFIIESTEYLEDLLKFVMRKAIVNEKLFIRTTIYGYEQKIINCLKNLGFKVAAEIPDMVSYDRQLYPMVILYLDLRQLLPSKDGSLLSVLAMPSNLIEPDTGADFPASSGTLGLGCRWL